MTFSSPLHSFKAFIKCSVSICIFIIYLKRNKKKKTTKTFSTFFLNYLRQNINFMVEYKKHNSLPFLDIIITKNESSFKNSKFWKITNFACFIPEIYKIIFFL